MWRHGLCVPCCWVGQYAGRAGEVREVAWRSAQVRQDGRALVAAMAAVLKHCC